MIQLIIGDKGSGKTKTIIEMMNKAVDETDGHVVCVEKGMKSTFNIKNGVRLVDVDDYNIRGCEEYFGFLMGVLAGDYDIEQVYIDGVIKVVGNIDELGRLLDKLNDIAPSYVRFIITVSADDSELTESIRKYL